MTNPPGDDRGPLLHRSIRAGRPIASPKHPVGSLKIKATWVYKPSKLAPHFHLPEVAFIGWYGEHRPRYAVRMRCGRIYDRFATSVFEPDGVALCDDCVLIDMRQHTVYRFFDAADQLLYVGYTVDPIERFSRHSKPYSESTRWWPLQHHYTLVTFDSEADARAAETRAIRLERPLYNRAGVPRSEWLVAA